MSLHYFSTTQYVGFLSMEAASSKLLKMTINDKDHLQHRAGSARAPASALARIGTERSPSQHGARTQRTITEVFVFGGVDSPDRLPEMGAAGQGSRRQRPAANTVLTTVVDTWG